MWAFKRFEGHFLKLLPLLSRGGTKNLNGGSSIITKASQYGPSLCSSFGCFHLMSTMKGRGMRSKVEKRMRRESAKTLTEHRRSKRIHKMLMTEDEKLIYSLRRAKKKVALLLQKLKKYELPELPPPQHDPELLTSEQLQAYKKIGFRNRNYVPVGIRGVFGGVVQNMHLHWKFHETVQVCCDNFPKEKIREMATMLARLSGGIVVNIHNVKTIIMFRGRNYRQPKNLIPINTLTKRKALFKARFEQALESQKLNIKKVEQQLRRRGTNPEDPIAMASIQRVASTFFRAIDEKEGTPYVFRENAKLIPEANENSREEDLDELSPEYSDQEELDRFIAEIEQAADLEWEKEEAAEKEEASKIRYWGRDDIGFGLRGRSQQNWRNSDSDDDRGHPRHFARADGTQRRNTLKKYEDDEDVEEASGEDWESDDDVDNVIAGIENNASDAIVSKEESHGLWRSARGKGGGSERVERRAARVDYFSDFDGSSEDVVLDSEGQGRVGLSASSDYEDSDGDYGHESLKPINSKNEKVDNGSYSD
ncbi:uncharacterized CRM domain-containing protein At3g25440, chloroplastic [Phalaenopsis equestris]|uniref:uncharacterized CRM domain-containing protein At3g25440, chloroplastic n=1 Tax=Phalaenopsis equestris TaxID=78828 RepID=UPI0009E45398|nr:uncharacterized CRM domain-containing protein At3g25440, chloroplastic [Phalaenopsis equestris]